MNIKAPLKKFIVLIKLSGQINIENTLVTKMKKYLSYILIFTGVFFLSCSAKYNAINSTLKINQLIGKVDDIRLIDERKDITDRDLKIPTITFPGQNDNISPKLTPENISNINFEIIKHFTQTMNKYIVNVYVQKGIKGFKAKTFTEIEYVECDIKIELIDDNKNSRSCTSSDFLQVKSLDASKNYTNLLFQKSIINAIHKCLENIKE